MSVRTQINIQQGNKIVRIYSGWGTPTNVLPALRKAANARRITPLSIAREFMRQIEDASFGLLIIAEDYDPDALSYRYTVDVSKNPWKIIQKEYPGHKIIDIGDGTVTADPNLSPGRTRTLYINTKTKAA